MEKKKESFDFVVELDNIKTKAQKLKADLKDDNDDVVGYVDWLKSVGDQATQLLEKIKRFEMEYLNTTEGDKND